MAFAPQTAYLLTRIDAYVKNHPEQKSRSGFLAEAVLRVLQGDCK